MKKSKKIIIFSLCMILVIEILVVIYINYISVKSNCTSNISNQQNIESTKEYKIMLADMLKNPDEFAITEDNIDNTDKIISRAELKSGVFIVNSSREKFLQVINTVTNANYIIDEKGYLQKPSNENIKSDIIDKFNNLIDSDKTLVINISNTYKGVLNDNMILDFMIERTMYVQTFNYNESIKIALINPDRLEEKSEDLTQKEIYEEALLGI